MTEQSPFLLDEAAPALAKATAGVSALYPDLMAAAVEQMATRGVAPDAPVVRRTLFSILIQIVASEAKDRGEEPFQVIDGIAHGLASWFSQADDDGAACERVLFAQTQGYRLRTAETGRAIRALAGVKPEGQA